MSCCKKYFSVLVFSLCLLSQSCPFTPVRWLPAAAAAASPHQPILFSLFVLAPFSVEHYYGSFYTTSGPTHVLYMIPCASVSWSIFISRFCCHVIVLVWCKNTDFSYFFKLFVSVGILGPHLLTFVSLLLFFTSFIFFFYFSCLLLQSEEETWKYPIHLVS